MTGTRDPINVYGVYASGSARGQSVRKVQTHARKMNTRENHEICAREMNSSCPKAKTTLPSADNREVCMACKNVNLQRYTPERVVPAIKLRLDDTTVAPINDFFRCRWLEGVAYEQSIGAQNSLNTAMQQSNDTTMRTQGAGDQELTLI